MLTIRPETLISRYASAANKVAERFNISLDMALQKIAEFRLCRDWTSLKNTMIGISSIGFGLTRFELDVVCLSIIGKNAPKELAGNTFCDYFLGFLEYVAIEGAEERIKMAHQFWPQITTDTDPLIPIIKKFRNMPTEDLVASAFLILFYIGMEWVPSEDLEMLEIILSDKEKARPSPEILVDIDPLERYDSNKLVIIDSEDHEQTLN